MVEVWLRTTRQVQFPAKTGPQRPDAPPTAQPLLLNHSQDSGWGGDRTCYAGGPLYRSGTRPIGVKRNIKRKSPQDSGDLVGKKPNVKRVWSTFGVDQFTLFIKTCTSSTCHVTFEPPTTIRQATCPHLLGHTICSR